MKIIVQITKKDILISLWSYYFNFKFNWIICFGISVLNSYGLIHSDKGYSLMAAIISGVIVAIVCFILGYIFQSIYVLSLLKKNTGQLGEHTFEILEEGLLEQTSVNQSITYWQGIVKLQETKAYLLIYISALQYHVLPIRNFQSHEEYKRFVKTINTNRKNHNKL